jgi:hypothetical protein
MIHLNTRKRVWEKLLESLGGAEAGGRELDIVIHYLIGAQAKDGGGEAGQMIALLVEEGYPWEVVSELLDADLPPYTTALDAALPGENIVLALYSPRRGRWAAVHEAADGAQAPVWAASECLARRRAALKGLGANPPARATATPTRPAKPVTPPAPEPAANRHGWSRIPEAEAPEKEAEAPEKEDEAEWKILF